AAGDAGGTITIWKVPPGTLQRQCIGSPHQILALAFSPDNMILASGGRYGLRLWDPAKGELLLNIPGMDALTDLAFSPDGRRLAASSETVFTEGKSGVWNLELGRGIRVFCGLTAQISLMALSHQETLLAALAHNWEVGIWDLSRNQLRH